MSAAGCVVEQCAKNGSNQENPDQYTEMWKGLWSARDTAWHLTHRNPNLVKYEDLLLNGNKSARLMFPFCGKVIDMKYFWEQGHQVFGIDCAPEAIKDFYSEQGIEYETKALDDKSTCYSTKDGRMNLINTNFYTFDNPMMNGKVECVWDRGAFGTITEDEQKLYIKTIRRLLAPNFRYLLLVLEFDNSQWDGVPFSQPEEKVRRFYGDFCEIEKLNSTIPQHLSLYQKHMQNPLEVKETVYFLTPKKA